jgi:hypothetical protein
LEDKYHAELLKMDPDNITNLIGIAGAFGLYGAYVWYKMQGVYKAREELIGDVPFVKSSLEQELQRMACIRPDETNEKYRNLTMALRIVEKAQHRKQRISRLAGREFWTFAFIVQEYNIKTKPLN